MVKKSYKKLSVKKYVKKHSPSKRSSSKRSSSKRSSSKRSSSKRNSSKRSSSRVRSHYRTVRKTRVKSHYRMKGMGHLLQMYGGASAELEAEHNACLVKYKELMGVHEEIRQSISDLRLNDASKSEINEQISKANDIREQIKDLVDGAGKCKEKQAALLESLKEVTHNVTEQLNDEVQAGGSAAEIGAKLDAFGVKAKVAAAVAGQKLSAGLKSVGQKLSSGINSAGQKLSAGISSVGASIKQKYNDHKDKKSLQKRIVDLSYCEKTFSKDELSSGSISV